MNIIQLRTLDKIDEKELKDLKYAMILDVIFKQDICILVVENTNGITREIQIRPRDQED